MTDMIEPLLVELERDYDNYSMMVVSTDQNIVNHLLREGEDTSPVVVGKPVIVVKLVKVDKEKAPPDKTNVVEMVSIRMDKSITFFMIEWSKLTDDKFFRSGMGGSITHYTTAFHAYYTEELFNRLEELLFKLEDKFGIGIMDRL